MTLLRNIINYYHSNIFNAKRLKIILATSRTGGPTEWGNNLVYSLNQNTGVQAVHVHTFKQLATLPFRNADILHTTVPLVQYLTQKPLVVTIHGNYRIEKTLWSRYYQGLIQAARVITVPSEFLKKELSLSDAIVIPNAVFSKPFSISNANVNDVIQLLTITNFSFLEKIRGLEELVNAILKTDFKRKIVWTILGGGKYISKIESIIGKYRNPKITIRLLGQQNVETYLKASNIFLYYSYLDNMPMAILEAMNQGLPVITNNIGAVSEMIKDKQTGFIAYSVEQFIQYVQFLIDQPNVRYAIGQAANLSIRQSFSWDRIVPAYLRIYETI